MEYIHAEGYAHRDIKLANVLVDRELKVKIIDFGFASNKETRHSMYCGTPSYMAPEIVSRMSYFGQPVDVWAFGVLIFRALTGDYPFGCILFNVFKIF